MSVTPRLLLCLLEIIILCLNLFIELAESQGKGKLSSDSIENKVVCPTKTHFWLVHTWQIGFFSKNRCHCPRDDTCIHPQKCHCPS